MDITSAAIATVISSAISSFVSTVIALRINKRNENNVLRDNIDSIIKISVEYPYLENPQFTSTWSQNKNSNEENYVRYDNYCTLVFNLMERICKHYKYNRKDVEKFINICSWIRLHQQCWKDPSIPFENTDSYDKKFQDFIDYYLR